MCPQLMVTMNGGQNAGSSLPVVLCKEPGQVKCESFGDPFLPVYFPSVLLAVKPVHYLMKTETQGRTAHSGDWS